MGITIGGIDPVNEIIDLKLRMGTLEKLILIIAARGITITQDQLDDARNRTIEELKEAYPQLGLVAKNA